MYGDKRLEVYSNDGSVRARIWAGSHCIYAVTL
jgi:hypothetical protein